MNAKTAILTKTAELVEIIDRQFTTALVRREDGSYLVISNTCLVYGD